MKILMFGWEFPPHITGGLGTACYGLVRGLLSHNADVTFVVPKVYGDEDKNIKLANASDVAINVFDKNFEKYHSSFSYLEVNSTLVPYQTPEEYYNIINTETENVEESGGSIYSKRYKFSGKYGRNILDEVKRYAMVANEIARNNDFDVIHAHDWLTYEAGIEAKKASGKPLVVHMHATEFDRSGENVNQLVYDVERRGMEHADLVVAVSHLTKNIVVERYGIPEEKVVVLHNAVEPVDKMAFANDKKAVKEKVVTFLGRITFQKGPDYFVEVAHKVLKKDKNVRFVMAGSGDMMNKIVKRAAELKIATRFHFTGFLKGEDVDRMFAHSDVYVMPSVSEPFGISPLEAMRSNVPTIISKQSGVSEVLNFALKCDFWDIDTMADYIYGLLHYDGISKMFAKNGKDEVDNLKWENAAKKLLKQYSSVLRKVSA
ncbi:MAG: 4-alpha-glucanotransferase [Bacteroidia bacterium]|nr:MAG: 4-alpha-glucanotransferase [Bacteroidia bacterium]